MEDIKQVENTAKVEAAVTEEVSAPEAVSAPEEEKLGFFKKIKRWFKNVNWKVVYDKVTTGILVFLIASPFLILLYIFLWFILK